MRMGGIQVNPRGRCFRSCTVCVGGALPGTCRKHAHAQAHAGTPHSPAGPRGVVDNSEGDKKDEDAGRPGAPEALKRELKERMEANKDKMEES